MEIIAHNEYHHVTWTAYTWSILIVYMILELNNQLICFNLCNPSLTQILLYIKHQTHLYLYLIFTNFALKLLHTLHMVLQGWINGFKENIWTIDFQLNGCLPESRLVMLSYKHTDVMGVWKQWRTPITILHENRLAVSITYSATYSTYRSLWLRCSWKAQQSVF